MAGHEINATNHQWSLSDGPLACSLTRLWHRECSGTHTPAQGARSCSAVAHRSVPYPYPMVQKVSNLISASFPAPFDQNAFLGQRTPARKCRGGIKPALWQFGELLVPMAHPHNPPEGQGRSRTRFVPLCQLMCAGMAKTHPSLLARWPLHSVEHRSQISITNHRHASQS